jgi:anti-sigma factor RsiW
MFTQHIPDDNLEAYSLRQLSSTVAAPVEDHLMVCESCQTRLMEWDEYVAAMRVACRKKREVPKARTAAGGCLPE